MDKTKIKEDYEHGYSLRQIAAKYGVSKSAVQRWVKQYGWDAGQRSGRAWDKGTGEFQEEIAPEVCTVRVPDGLDDKDYALVRGYALALMDKGGEMLRVDNKLTARDLKSLSSMLLDIRELLGLLSPREMAEYELRLVTLKKQAGEVEGENGVVVQFVQTEGAEE